MNYIKVLHTGDFHLGYDYGAYDERSMERAAENLGTFSRVIDLCMEKNVDVMLIAGDLFDNDNPDTSLIDYVVRGFRRIGDVIIMIAPGNHDYYRAASYYDRISTLCENVFIFDGEMDFYEFRVRENIVRIYGAGFTDSIIKNTMMKQRKIFRDISINLGVFHGEIGNERVDSKYAPMSLRQIEENCFDYLALGHIHKQTEILCAGRTNYAYCGCPEGLSFKTPGVKGVYVGTVEPGRADMEYIRTCKRMYLEETFGFDGRREDFTDTIAAAAFIRSRLKQKYGDNYTENLYRITLEDSIFKKIDRFRLEEELRDIYYVQILYEGAERGEEKSSRADRNFINKRQTEWEKSEETYFEIKKIHIVSFGGLKAFKMNFEQGFQIIYGENEYGKSTVMAFIKMMLYGCGSKSRDIAQNLRKKYQPFDGSTMKGSLEFAVNGITYVIEREFGKSKSYDKCLIFEMEGGREISFSRELEPGDYFLSISQEDFERTMFSGDMTGISGTGEKSALLSRIANLSGGLQEDMDISLELKGISRKMEALQSKRSVSGKIPELNTKIAEYENEIKRLKEEKSYLKEMVKEEKADRESLKRERRVISELLRKMEKLRNTENHEEYRRFKLLKRKKSFISVLVMLVVFAITGSIIFVKSKDLNISLQLICGAGVAVILILFFKRIAVNRQMSRCMIYDEKLQERINVIVEEFGYKDYSVGDLEERLEKIDEILGEGGENRREEIGRGITSSRNRGIEISSGVSEGERIRKGNDRIDGRIEECRRRTEELKQKKTEYIRQFDELKEEADALRKLMEQAGSSITADVNRRAAELFSEMSGNEYESFMVDEAYNVRIRKKGSAVYEDWRHLSTATASQAYLSLRISLCEALGNGKIIVPLLFDDILSSYDEERAARTVKVLRQLDMQVILFTCHRWLYRV